MANTVIGIFESESKAQEAQNYLLANGFAAGDVDISTSSYNSDTTASTVNRDDEDFGDRIGNFFKDLFDGDEDETRRYSEAGKRGTIVTVHAIDADEAETAAAILDQYGAVDIDETAAGYVSSQGYAGTATESSVNTYADNSVDPYANRSLDVVSDGSLVSDSSLVSDDQTDSLPVIREELQVEKREIETGGVRLRSRIIERPVQESIRLRQEQVNVTRTPVDRIASESDFDTFKEGTIEMTEYAEVPLVSKEARVVEEISLNKTVDEREEVINETLRNTEVEVEDLTDEERLRRSGLDL
ncbi:YsnF/AvaK domain-containing protein [Dyadobacter fanqingshengii]|uniref:YsnF/AvaK domain-containing protein n=1 Tax=Dyadobacter fanqingshengii TaxID=2906443 RepID=A0A9X1TGU6_9BACT|nr:YsnF/AvaK domain-containing protein [Dyadobacter fanqingshengii]MCF0040867.1 YsnF/AvaK domain-containing protein [Dyadobacter fanqingshengii]USJ37401.1 YsnF/AvaK domain-containing protein [Dyadobacter fanqingshengii]